MGLRSTAWNYFEVCDPVQKTARCLNCERTLCYSASVSNLTKHRRRCEGLSKRTPREPKRGENVWEYFSKPGEGEDSTACKLCQEPVSKESMGEHLRTKHPNLEVLEDDDLTDASGDRLDVSGDNREEKAWNFFSRTESGEAAECRLCSEAVPCDGPALINHLLTLHADTPLDEAKKTANNVKIETFYVDEVKVIPNSTSKCNKAKRRHSKAEDVRPKDKEEQTMDGSLEPFASYCISLLKDMPAKEARRLQLDFIVQIHKTRQALDKRKRRRVSSESSSSDG